jgi:Grx4 family monothiol glutaredoxin
MSTLKELTTLTEWEEHVSALPSSTTLIIYFHAPWAAPCAQMATFLKTLAADYPATTPPTTSWVSVDGEELSDLSEKYGVTAVPFLAIQRGGVVLDTVSGSNVAKVRAAIETHLSPAAESGESAKKEAAPVTEPEVEKAEADLETTKEDLFKRLGDLVKAAPVMLFMKGTPSEPQCGFSRQMVAILRENAVKYGFFNILADDEVRQGLKEFAEWPTFPQLWMDGELVGGLDIVRTISPRRRVNVFANESK